MNSMADKLKEKKFTDDETEAYHTLLRCLKVFQKVDDKNVLINDMIVKMENVI